MTCFITCYIKLCESSLPSILSMAMKEVAQALLKLLSYTNEFLENQISLMCVVKANVKNKNNVSYLF